MTVVHGFDNGSLEAARQVKTKTRRKPVPSAERREQLLQTAADLVRQGGLSALTMEALAERADVPKPTVYRHFANRQAVAVALIDRHFRDILGFVEQQVSDAPTLTEAIGRMLEAPPAFEQQIRALPIHGFGSGHSGEAEIDAAFLRYEKIFQEHWCWRMEQRGVDPVRARAAARFFHAMASEGFRSEGQIRRLPELDREVLTSMFLGALHALGAKEELVNPTPPPAISFT
jgi:AcrR family transcriptional regulator